MKMFPKSARPVLAVVLGTVLWSGCCKFHQTMQSLYQSPPTPAPLGARSDPIWKLQEASAEASEFVVYQHEFEYNGVRLNHAGEEHVKQIAVRLQSGADVPVVIERTNMAVREDSEFKYPVNPNSELDMQRREVVVRSLAMLGVNDADPRVVVATAYAPGVKATEAAASYGRSMQYGGGGYGGGYGGMGAYGGGGFGPFGGFR